MAWSSWLLLLLQLPYKRANGGGDSAAAVVLCLDSGPLGASAAATAGCMFCCISSHFGNTLVSCSCSFCCRRCCCPQVPFGTLLHPTSSLFALPATLLFFPVELSQTLWDVVVVVVVVCLAKSVCVSLPALSQCLWPCSSSSSSCRWSTEGTPRQGRQGRQAD